VGVYDVSPGNTFGAQLASYTGGTTAALSITLPVGGINAGDTLDVTFQATNPTTAATYTISVSTSASPQPATTSVTIASPSLTVSASNQVIGAPATYTFTNVPGNNSTSLTLTANGTVVFGSVTGDYTVTNESVSPPASDTVDTVALLTGNHSVTLTLASPTTTGDLYTVTADGTNPTSPETVTFYVNGAAAGPSIGFGLAVGSVSVVPSPATAGVAANYTITFESTDGIPQLGSINITGPTGTTFGNGAVALKDVTSGAFQVAIGTASGNTITGIGVTNFSVAKGDIVQLTVFDVTNPAAGSYSGTGGLEVTTSSDPLPAYNVQPYVIAVAAPANVIAPTVTVTPNTPSSVATYVISPFVAKSNLVAGTDTIEVQAPAGTVLPGSGYSLTDKTTASGTQTLTVRSFTSANDVVLSLASNVNAGDVLSLSISNVVNPSSGSTSYTISLGADSVATNATQAGTQGLAAQGVPFPSAAISYPNGAIVDFSGTNYVFAGGMAFQVAPSQLSALQKVDPATIITAPAGATPPMVSAPVAGTLLKALGSAEIYVVNTDGTLYGFATVNQLTSLGYDPAVNVTVPSLGSLTVSTTSAGKANITALDTLSSGAIINTSPTFYVLAGGYAFGIPGPKALALVQKTDPAQVLKGTVPASALGPSAKIMNGTVITVNGVVYVAYNDQLYSFASMKELDADGFGGTASITVPSTFGLSVVPRPYGSS
jgi:hypothetical protein